MPNKRVLINGFGRIGRAFFRNAIVQPNIQITGINDKYLSTDEISYLANYDTVYGRLDRKVQREGNRLSVHGSLIDIYQSDNLSSIPLESYDYVVFCSGDLTSFDTQVEMLNKFSCKVLFTSFVNDHRVQDFIFGYHNEKLLSSKYLSLNICDAVATLPIYNHIRQSCHIDSASIITLHPYLPYQNLLDGKSRNSSNIVLGRSAINNLIPKDTSLEKVLSHYFPRDHIMCMSYRVPTNSVACASMHLFSQSVFSDMDIQKMLSNACDDQWKDIGLYSEDNCVSSDFCKSPYSFIIDHQWLRCTGNQIRISFWYDNEWGYAMRIIDAINKS
jgi:glyceraldehyde 3-phosphate dehydrogenase